MALSLVEKRSLPTTPAPSDTVTPSPLLSPSRLPHPGCIIDVIKPQGLKPGNTREGGREGGRERERESEIPDEALRELIGSEADSNTKIHTERDRFRSPRQHIQGASLCLNYNGLERNNNKRHIYIRRLWRRRRRKRSWRSQRWWSQEEERGRAWRSERGAVRSTALVPGQNLVCLKRTSPPQLTGRE